MHRNHTTTTYAHAENDFFADIPLQDLRSTNEGEPVVGRGGRGVRKERKLRVGKVCIDCLDGYIG